MEVRPHHAHRILWKVATTIILAAIVGGLGTPVLPHELATENVLLVTLDGLRWQELFSGAELRLIDKDVGGVREPQDIQRRYWREEATARREVLMPFFWNVVAREGQVFGAPEAGSVALVKNGRYFSYPGYQEILCGFPDAAIDSNDKVNNRNVTVLEWLHRKPEFMGRVAAFTSWDVFPFILNAQRSGLYVNSGWDELDHARSKESLALVNRIARDTPHYWQGVRFDAFTMFGATEYLRMFKPRLLYLSIGETDDWCHDGRYDMYLESAHMSDRLLKELWELVQSMDEYAGKTSLVLTTDHGRGDGREGWKNHGADLPGSEQIWMAVLGPDTPVLGLRENVNVTQGQTAATVAQLLGYDYAATDERIAPPLPGVLKATAE